MAHTAFFKKLSQGACVLTLAGALVLPMSPAIAADTPDAGQQINPTNQASDSRKLTVDNPNFDIINGGTITLRGTGYGDAKYRNQDGGISVGLAPQKHLETLPHPGSSGWANYIGVNVPASHIKADGSFEVQVQVPARALDPSKGPYGVGTFTYVYRGADDISYARGPYVKLNANGTENGYLHDGKLELNPVKDSNYVYVTGGGYQLASRSTTRAQLVEVDAAGNTVGQPLASKKVKVNRNGTFSAGVDISGEKVDPAKRYALVVVNEYAGQTKELGRKNLNVYQPNRRISNDSQTPINPVDDYNTVSVFGQDFRLDNNDQLVLELREKGSDTVIGTRTFAKKDAVLPSSSSSFLVHLNIRGSQVDASKEYEVTLSVKSEDPSHAFSQTLQVPVSDKSLNPNAGAQ